MSKVSHSPFGDDPFGRRAETAARFFGTPQREVALKRQTDELKTLLAANTELTRQDKELACTSDAGMTLERDVEERGCIEPTRVRNDFRGTSRSSR